ncbi:MAG TPA: hypothetical protein VD860_16950 [Azospirillum sp.]|nr:hypothetical protein [Azospirillum sp.]
MRGPIAYSFLREQPHYRSDAFHAGLRACGFTVKQRQYPAPVGPGDIVLVWNRYGQGEIYAKAGERAGATVLIAENGYLGADAAGVQLYALAVGQHNGAGRWLPGDRDRMLRQMGAFQPWRDDGRHILVLPSRGVGPAGVGQPSVWTDGVVADLRRRTDRPVRVRLHPGTTTPPTTLEQDLEGAWAVVTWGSGAAIKALALGVPVFFEMPQWIGAAAALPLSADLEAPFLGDRVPMFERLSGAQASLDEISSGTAFRRLLSL